MDDSTSMQRSVTENVALARRLTTWLRAAGVKHSEMAVDIADIIFAARDVAQSIEDMLVLQPNQPHEADKALEYVGKLRALLFSELKPHIEDLEQTWPELEQRLDKLSPDDQP